jgi:hypothetical protein
MHPYFWTQVQPGQTFNPIDIGMYQRPSSSRCKSCQSINESTFNGEIAIHFRGLEGLDKPIVWVFPKIAVCLNCGFAEFMVPERELQVLAHGIPVEGAVVLLQAKRKTETKG